MRSFSCFYGGPGGDFTGGGDGFDVFDVWVFEFLGEVVFVAGFEDSGGWEGVIAGETEAEGGVVDCFCGEDLGEDGDVFHSGGDGDEGWLLRHVGCDD